MAPEVLISPQKGPFHRGQKITFEASVANEDAASIRFAWNKTEGACGPKPVAWTSDATGSSFVFTPGSSELGDFCIRVQATDSQGAHAIAQSEIRVSDRQPEVALMQVQPAAGSKARLGSEVVVSAVASDPDPGDVPVFTLALQTPDGEDVAFGTCEDAKRPASERCFVVTTPGPWVVTVKWGAADATRSLVAIDRKLEVMADEDQPPCLLAMPRAAQVVQDAREPLHFEVFVADDLDAFPTTSQGSSKARFQWSVSDSSSSTFLALVEQTDRVYVLPNRYLPADEMRVRVDVFDRVARPATCKASDDVCGTSLCLQRMTWTVRFR